MDQYNMDLLWKILFFLRYFFIALKRHNDQGSLKKEVFNSGLASSFRGVVPDYQGPKHGSRQSWHQVGT